MVRGEPKRRGVGGVRYTHQGGHGGSQGREADYDLASRAILPAICASYDLCGLTTVDDVKAK